jgi:Haem-NO-binding
MYGMINIAIQDMISDRYGKHKWEAIRAAIGTQIDDFVSLDSYPDELTYALVAKASELLPIETPVLLEDIGEYWIIHTAKNGYGELLDTIGKNMVDFLNNLNSMHSRLTDTMPHMVVPTFRLSDITDHSMKVHYYSHRKGLEHMVTGLLRGVAKRFGIDCSIQMSAAEAVAGTSQIYLVTW